MKINKQTSVWKTMALLTIAILPTLVFSDTGFDLLKFSRLVSADKEKMVINPASRKKEADAWKPPRKLTAAECTKLIRIMTDRFGEPAKCRCYGYVSGNMVAYERNSFVYVWRFEGDEWLSVGVFTDEMSSDPIAIHHWDWRKPELSVYTETEMRDSQKSVQKCAVVDYIIQGEARLTAKKCVYPLPIPLISDIRDEADFVRRFPIVFDEAVRRKLAKLKSEEGWDFNIWGGGERCSCFGRGELWFEHEGDRLTSIALTSAPLFDYWQKQYHESLLTLAPKYRQGCFWEAYYFISEDGAYFGRVDSLGTPWRRPGIKYLDDIINVTENPPNFSLEPGCKVDDRFRVMLFKRRQKTTDEPYRVFYCDAEEDLECGNCYAGEISSIKDGFSFYYHDELRRNKGEPEMELTFNVTPGKEIALRLKQCAWPPPNAKR